ncbi:hypothetical protein NDU88_001010 [Pleurodeles waltl]|uniref:Uncharacterized protein n=1 Tax=Pleurodeles waltl TaxID=8319 RepID=A0AAV7S8W6_PLEWA|nr:hypothetical protein NDU88_001010 [Pleurodeles waltl]
MEPSPQEDPQPDSRDQPAPSRPAPDKNGGGAAGKLYCLSHTARLGRPVLQAHPQPLSLQGLRGAGPACRTSRTQSTAGPSVHSSCAVAPPSPPVAAPVTLLESDGQDPPTLPLLGSGPSGALMLH